MLHNSEIFITFGRRLLEFFQYSPEATFARCGKYFSPLAIILQNRLTPYYTLTSIHL